MKPGAQAPSRVFPTTQFPPVVGLREYGLSLTGVIIFQECSKIQTFNVNIVIKLKKYLQVKHKRNLTNDKILPIPDSDISHQFLNVLISSNGNEKSKISFRM